MDNCRDRAEPLGFLLILFCCVSVFVFLTYETEFVLFLAVLKNSVLAHGLRQFTRGTDSDINCYAPIGKTPNDVRSWPPYNVNDKNQRK